jgi:hypothetical protein
VNGRLLKQQVLDEMLNKVAEKAKQKRLHTGRQRNK